MTAPRALAAQPADGRARPRDAGPGGHRGPAHGGRLWLQPGAAVLGEHVHSALTETFAVVEGKVGYTLDGTEGVAWPGETLHIPVGARHDWWNAGEDRAHARFALDSADPAVPMAGRFFASIEAGWGLAAAGKTNAKGMPTPLWLASLARETVTSYRSLARLRWCRRRCSRRWRCWPGRWAATSARPPCTATAARPVSPPRTRTSATRCCGPTPAARPSARRRRSASDR